MLSPEFPKELFLRQLKLSLLMGLISERRSAISGNSGVRSLCWAPILGLSLCLKGREQFGRIKGLDGRAAKVLRVARDNRLSPN